MFIVRVMEQSSTTFRCPRCPETRTSQRALNRHIKWHNKTGCLVGSPVRKVVVNDTLKRSPASAVCVDPRRVPETRPNGSAVQCGPLGKLEEAHGQRPLLDAAVKFLKSQHLHDRTFLSKRTEELVRVLGEKEPKLPRLARTGIVVAAKHFAGTASPRRPAIKPPEKLPSGEGSRIDHGRVEAAKIKRRLFSRISLTVSGLTTYGLIRRTAWRRHFLVTRSGAATSGVRTGPGRSCRRRHLDVCSHHPVH